MRKIVFNNCYGGFGLSEDAKKLYKKLSGEDGPDYIYDIPRHDPYLVKVVEKLKGKASSCYADLKIHQIEDNKKYIIDEYDGNETVKTPEDYDWK